MNGLTTIKHFRSWEQKSTTNKRTPIAVVTAKAFQEDRKQAYCAGCDVYLTKPISKVMLLKNLLMFTNLTALQNIKSPSIQ